MTIIEYSVGCKWSFEQLNYALELNDKFSNKNIAIKEFYGSLPSSISFISSARPDYRLVNIDWKFLHKFTKKCASNSIEVAYTANATLNSSLEDLEKRLPQIRDALKRLEDIGIARIIIANPLFAEIVKYSCSLPVGISTILRPEYLSQIPVYQKWRADSICLDIYKNRNIDFLKEFTKIAQTYKIKTTLLVNEFCQYGTSPCSGILRQSCNEHSSMGGNRKGLFDNWPFQRCCAERIKHPCSWLQSSFILPQHVRLYNNMTGIKKFKITGRTNSLRQIMNLMKWYMSENFRGRIPMLWVDPGDESMKTINQNFFLTPSDLNKVSFFDRWFKQRKPCDFSCKIKCSYCLEKFKEACVICKR